MFLTGDWTSSVMWRAFADESEPQQHGLTSYLLAAAIMPCDACECARATMMSLLAKGQRKLHWHSESESRRRKIIAAVVQLDAMHLVVIRPSRSGESAERRRRKCLERFLPELDARDVEDVRFESREAKQNARDRQMLDVLRARHAVSSRIRISHTPGPSEPLLWIADTVAGAVAADRRGNPEYLELLRPKLHIIELKTT